MPQRTKALVRQFGTDANSIKVVAGAGLDYEPPTRLALRRDAAGENNKVQNPTAPFCTGTSALCYSRKWQ